MRWGQDAGQPQVPTTSTSVDSANPGQPFSALPSHLASVSDLAQRQQSYAAKRSEVPSSQESGARFAFRSTPVETPDPMAVLLASRPSMAASQWPIDLATHGCPWVCGDIPTQIQTSTSTQQTNTSQHPSAPSPAPPFLFSERTQPARNVVTFQAQALHMPEAPSPDVHSAATDPSPPPWQREHPKRPVSTQRNYQLSTHNQPSTVHSGDVSTSAPFSLHNLDSYRQHQAMHLQGQYGMTDPKVDHSQSAPQTFEQVAADTLQSASTAPLQVAPQAGLGDVSWQDSRFAFASGTSSLGLFLPREDEALIPPFLRSATLKLGAPSVKSENMEEVTRVAVKSSFQPTVESLQLGMSDRRTQAKEQTMPPVWTPVLANPAANFLFPSTVPHKRKQETNYESTPADIHAGRVSGPPELRLPFPSPQQFEPTPSQREVLSCSPHRLARHQGGQWNKCMPNTLRPQYHSRPPARLLLPQKPGSSVFLLLNSEDRILWSTDTFETCSSLLLDGDGCSRDGGDLPGHQLLGDLSTEETKFSDLLADEQTVLWWQQACHEILSARYQQQRRTQQTPNCDRTLAQTLRCSKDLILKWKGRPGEDETWVEVGVSATEVSPPMQEGCLLVKIKPVSLPSLATISSRPMLSGSDTRSRFSSSLLPPAHKQGGMSDTAELRLLVSRHGLILRSTCPTQFPSVSQTPGPMGQVAEAPALFAILGEGASLPAFGQSLVDIPKLTPLLHVVAQAAIVGLAQTVKLNAGGRPITAVVQPVLRTAQVASTATQRTHLPSAKVWITLSAVVTVMKRPKSSPSMSTTGLNTSFAQFMGLHPPTPHAMPDRRRSVQAYELVKASPMLPPNYVPQVDRRASTASLYVHAALAQASTSAQQHAADVEARTGPNESTAGSTVQRGSEERPLQAEDSLSQLMAQLQEENRKLRQQVEERRHRWRTHAQSQSQPLSQNSNTMSRTIVQHPSAGTPGSCPTELLYLS